MRAAVFLLFVGCSSDVPFDPIVDAPPANPDGIVVIDAPAGSAFALASTTITEGQPIPLTHVCPGRGGTNLSPQLSFVSPPAGTMSFVVTLTDMTNSLVHAAIYDIAGTATELPADVERVYAPPEVAGAHQTNGYDNVRGYAGPCPPNMHVYRFTAYALSTATLPGVSMNSSKDEVVTAAATNLGVATLTGTFTP